MPSIARDRSRPARPGDAGDTSCQHVFDISGNRRDLVAELGRSATRRLDLANPVRADQPWFDMDDVRRPRIATASWIPLRARRTTRRGEYWKPGCVEEHFAAVGIVLPADRRAQALEINWTGADRGHDRPWVEHEDYFPAGTFSDYRSGLAGNYPVLAQQRDADGTTDWYLDQDVLFALELKRENDSWVCPAEDFIEVARLRRDESGRPELLEVRAEQFRDYLCARSSGLLVATYRSRRAVFPGRPSLDWETPTVKRAVEGGHWEGTVNEIDATGAPFGSGVSVLKLSRHDPELDEEVPILEPPGNRNVRCERRTFQCEGPCAVLVSGELWRNEWVEPGTRSPRVRHDRTEPTIPFIIENDGSTAAGAELKRGIQWLWFSPRVILDILRRRGGALEWYSEDTGCVGLASHSPLHFGVNELGLVNIFATDIAELPEHAQKLWASHNVTPEAGVSRELLASQMEVDPAATVAPEDELRRALSSLQESSLSRFSRPLLRPHTNELELLSHVQRFQCVEPNGTYRLCKEITRVITDRVDVELLKEVRPGDDKKLGSLKRVERLLSERGIDGRSTVAPLVGVYELRLADAHPPSSEADSALGLLGVNLQMNEVQRGKQIIRSVALAIEKIAAAI
jgi:hypothetical protein